MADSLDKWQERLERHFESLARTRGDTGFPIFALEHGLNETQLEQLSQILRSCLTVRQSLSPHWLLWVIYATERGYSYTGDEYWPSFEEQTPGWEFDDRNKIKWWFQKFQKAYHGVIPSGPWAEHFSIIAWPITHAILPRYLQSQFARALYDLRFNLASFTNLDPRTIGRHLAANAQYTSTRFQEFLQQEQLTGRIVLALLNVDPSQGKEPIYPSTLRRIVADLEKVRNAREWLNDTRRVVSDRFQGIGRSIGPSPNRAPAGTLGRTVQDAETPNIRPNLLLRHTGGGTWSALLEVLSFRSIAVLSADLQSFLQRTRCCLNGGNGMKPTGWLLSGNRKGVLKKWPDPAKPLIQFEHPLPALDNFLENECRLSRGPIWLFKIGSDGVAREITGRVVRPGQRYLVVTTEELPQAHAGVTLCNLECEGARAVRLAMPSDVSVETTEWLHGLGLQVARTVRVWPAGLPGRGWDGEGKSEWLTTEAPCFGIKHDHPVDGYMLSLDNGQETIIKTDGAKHIFVRIPPLPVGTHSLTIKAFQSSSLDAIAPSSLAEGHAQLSVREPESWTPGVATHPGLIITVDPHDPDLGTLWRNEVCLSVFGPEGYTVTFTVRLLAADGLEIFSKQIGAPMNLPVKPKVWQRNFQHFLKRDEHAWIYLEAARGELIIEGEALGRYSLRCEHEALPLRWLPRKVHGDIILRLVDDSGQDGANPQIRFNSMDRPLKVLPLTIERARFGSIVKPPGGLFLAKHGAHSDTLFISTGLAKEGLEGLSAKPTFPELMNRSISIAEALRLLASWHEARLSGPLASIRQKQIINDFLQAVFNALYSTKWMTEEEQLRKTKSKQSLEFLKRAVNKHLRRPIIQVLEKRGDVVVRRRSSFAETLNEGHTKMERNPSQGALWFCNVTSQFKIREARKLYEFALRLASQPHRLPAVYGRELDRLLKEVTNIPAILLGARLLAIISASRNDDTAFSLLPRWKW